MVQKCFLCTGDIRSSSSTKNSKEDSTLLLCQILGLPHLELNLMNSEGIDYCHRCSYRILSIRDMLDTLEKLEKKIMDEKYLIEVQLKEKARQGNCDTDDFENSDPAIELRKKLGRALTAGTIQSMLNKIYTKQVDRTDYLCSEGPFRIVSDRTIQDNSEITVQPQCPLSERENRMLISPIEDEQSPENSREVLESGLNGLSPISSTEFEFLDDQIETKYETRLVNSNLSEVQHNPFDDELIPLSEYAAQNRMYDQITAGTSTGTLSMTPPIVKCEVKVEQSSEGTFNTFICQTCGSSLDNYNELLIHDRLHTRTTKSNFNISQTSRARTQTRHLIPSQRPKKCEECGRMLATHSSWRSHVMQVHRRQHKYNCALCSFGCQTKSKLDGHMSSHSDVRNFKCHLCLASFKQKKGLDHHFRTHTG